MEITVPKIFSVYVTFPNLQQAEQIGDYAVENNLAACVNIIAEKVSSIYKWQGKVTKDLEVAALFKTSENKLPELISAIENMHSYECPCIVAFPIINASSRYADWIIESLQN
jgi:periplasmic divalent cation tolerance protein